MNYSNQLTKRKVTPMKKLFALIAIALLLSLSACSEKETRYEVREIQNSRNETFYVVIDKHSEQKRFTIVSENFPTPEQAQAVCDSIEADWKKNEPKTD